MRTQRLTLVAVLLLSGLVASLTPSVAHAGDLDEATTAYAQQKYERAAAAYERAVAAGVRNEIVYYNLGNAYFRAGKLGPAILNYERALRLEPDLGDARYNLDVAREAVSARLGKDSLKGVMEESFWVRAVDAVPLPILIVAVILLDIGFFAFLIALRFIPTGFTRTGLTVGAVFAGVAGLAAVLLLAGRLYWIERVRTSIVVADEVMMRELPDASSREMPKLHAGMRVVAVRESQGWWRIRLANHVEGWVPKESVEPI
jgi:tetratricopeptide (TPR) repeat protein